MTTEKRHNYEYAVNVETQTAPAKVVRMVGSSKRVLEIGAGPGSISKMLQKNSCKVTGVEIDPSAIEKLTEFCEDVYQCDLNAPDWTSALDKCGTYDVLVAADVFEHLYWPHRSLETLKRFFSPDGYLVVSLPHVGNNAILAAILAGNFEYRDWGLLDKTHIRFFCLQNMQDLFEKAGYKILAAEFVVTPPAKTELAHYWQSLPANVQTSLLVNKFGAVYQVVMKIVPQEFKGEAIKLTDLPAPTYNISGSLTFKDRIKPFVPPVVWSFLRTLASK